MSVAGMLVAGVIGLALGAGCQWALGGASRRRREAEAAREAEVIRREADVRMQAERLAMREDFETATAARRQELERKSAEIEGRLAAVAAGEAELEVRREALRRAEAEVRAELQRVAGLGAESAREILMQRVETEARAEQAALLHRLRRETGETAAREAQRVVGIAIQRYAAGHVADSLTATVVLPNVEMKGRVIGREGRNIRALEAATGVSVLIDDAPESVTLSAFDPVRREVAREALQTLVADGRIHPARIEEVVAEVRTRLEATILKAGEEAVYALGLPPPDPEVMRALGRLRYRTSFSQNVLNHSIEVARLMGLMAGELGLDVALARRVGLFHDIGKALDHDQEGGHADIGAAFLRRLGETPEVVAGVAEHHQDIQTANAYAALAAAADAISGGRPGARVETTELYIKRLEKLEAIAAEQPGVTKAYAMHAGREMRVFVVPEQVDDAAAALLARRICNRIETEVKYPGQVRVVVIRETRCVEYAR